MKRHLAVTFALACVVPAYVSAQSPTVDPASCSKQATRIVHTVYAHKRWEHRHPLSDQGRVRLRGAIGCSEHPAKSKRQWTRAKHSFFEYRAMRRVAPFHCGSSYYAIPCYIVSCESKFNPRARNTSSTAGGYYQILNTSWYAYGGSHYSDSHPAAVAPELEQHQVGRRIWNDVGPSAWSCA